MDHSGFQELLEEFLLEARERTDEVESLMLRIATGDAATRETAMAQVKRELHTLKGNAGMMGYSDLQQLSHHLEDEVETVDLANPYLEDILEGLDLLRKGLETIQMPTPFGMDLETWSAANDESASSVRPVTETSDGVPDGARSKAGGAQGPAGDGVASGGKEVTAMPETITGSVRLPFSKIDQLVEVQAETLIFRNRLSDSISRSLMDAREPVVDGETYREQLIADLETVDEARQALEKTLNQLQEQVTELGMVPLRGLFRSLRRVVYDESRREGKKVEIEEVGGDTPIDKTLLEAANEVLGHLVRNSVIHGIEDPETRARRGKPVSGTVRVAASLEGSEVRIDVADDGGGIDYETLRRKAGAVAGEIAQSNYDLVFADGLSTRAGADLGAGRGVGLSAVKRGVESHGGRIEIQSQRGAGTRFILRLPITTSILHSLLVSVDGEEYALPLTAITESQRLERLRQHELNHAPVVPWRGRLIPLLDLGLAFGTTHQVREKGYFIIIDVNGRQRGLGIDDIVGIRDIVVKGLDKIVGRPTGISGSTILGDGRVIMILDPNALASMSWRR